MYTNDKCWMRNSCIKFKSNKECLNENFCMRLYKISELYSKALIPENKWNDIQLSCGGIDAKAFTELSYIENHIIDFMKAHANLYIYSQYCGNGKTEWALRLLKKFLSSIWIRSPLKSRALFINVPSYLLALKDSISNQSDYIDHIKANILEADLVVWDEIGFKENTQYEMDNLLSIINSRLDSGKCNIYTSNTKPNDLPKLIGDRLSNRIIQLSKIIEFNETGKRGLK